MLNQTLTVQLNLNYTHVTHVKLQNLVCAHTASCNFDVHMLASKHVQHMRDVRHELALGLAPCTCGAAKGTVAVGNEM